MCLGVGFYQRVTRDTANSRDTKECLDANHLYNGTAFEFWFRLKLH